MSADRYENGLDHPPLAAGSNLAPGYEIVEHLHQSNNFDVYYVFSEERACRCIAKVARQDLLEIPNVQNGLLREGKLLRRLAHPHIVRLYEILEEPYPILILEMLTGETLSHIIDTSYRRLPLRSVVNLGLHLCSAVHYLHAHGILHLDLKPSNVVSDRGLAKILDLSIAQPPGRCRKGAGTKQYMAPEQVRGERVGPATDVWGIGATLYEAATDVTPFNAEYEAASGSNQEAGSDTGSPTEMDLDAYEQILRRAEPVRSHRRVPAGFAHTVDACLQPDPTRRPTLEELTRTLEALT
jgi:serine/threonine protein kinase